MRSSKPLKNHFNGFQNSFGDLENHTILRALPTLQYCYSLRYALSTFSIVEWHRAKKRALWALLMQV